MGPTALPRSTPAKLRTSRRHTVNRRLLLITLVLLALGLPAAYFWYKHQLRQTATAFLARAEQLEQDRDWAQATSYYQRYLAINPEDTEVLVKLVKAYAQGEPNPNRIARLNTLLYQTLGRVPDRDDLRRLLAENLLKIGSFAEAGTEAKKLLDHSPDDARVGRRIIALSLIARANADSGAALKTALKALLLAADESPGDVELVEVTANALREHPSAMEQEGIDAATRADQLIDQLVAANPRNAAARITRHRYRARHQLPETDEDLRLALEIEPENYEALLLSAVSSNASATTKEQRANVESELSRAIKIAPTDPRAYHALAMCLEQWGRPEDAMKLLQQGRTATQDNFGLGMAFAHAQIKAGQADAAARTVQELESQKANYLVQLDSEVRTQIERQLRLLQARLDVAQGKLRQAIPVLQAILVSTDGSAADRRSTEWMQASQLLAQIHAGLGQWDVASEYWDALARTLPGELEVVGPTVASHLRSGNFKNAIDRIDDFARTAKPTSDMLVQRVQAHFAIQSGRPPEDRNWTEFESALQAAKAEAGDRWELVFAELDFLRAQSNDTQAATGLLRSSEQRFSDQADFWSNAARVYQVLGQADDAARALARHRELATSPLEHARLQAAFLASAGEFQKADAALSELGSSLPPDDRRQIDRLRVSVLAAGDKLAEAFALVKPLIDETTTDGDLLTLGTDVAFAAGDLATAEAWETQLRKATNDGPDARYLQARRLLFNFEKLNPAAKRELEQLIAGIRAERPQWFPILAIAARFSQLQGDNRQALADYQLAADRGDRRPATLQQLTSLLYEAGNFEEAQRYLSQLAAEQVTNSELDSMAIDIAVKQDRPAIALDLARQGVERFPDDPVRHLYWANLLLLNGKQTEALNALQTAAQKFADDPRVWTGLFNGLVQADKPEGARKVLESLLTNPKLALDRRHLVAAQGYQSLGDLPAARQQYELAIAQNKTDTAIRLSYAKLLLASDPRAAQGQLEAILQLEPLNREARRELAVLLAATGQETDWTRANALLTTGTNEPATDAATNDRLRALLLSQKGRTRAERLENCQAARRILQQPSRAESGEAGDLNRLLLAQIFEREAALSEDQALLIAADDQYRSVLDHGSPNAARLSQYIEFLLRHGGAKEPSGRSTASESELAERAKLRATFLDTAETRLLDLKRMRTSAENGLDALLTALTARLLQARGLDSQARDHVTGFIAQQSAETSDPVQQSQRYLTFGRLYSAIGAHAEAETWYRRLMQESPNAYLLVAQALVEQGKRREAAQFCLDLSKGNPDPEMAALLANILTFAEGEAGSDDEGLSKIRSAIEAAVNRHAADTKLLQAEAVMVASRGEYDQAIKLFRQIVELEPGNALALNNLATILAEMPNQRAEALKHIERAIEIEGRQASLLDTQGTILLKLGDAQKAIACLEEATAGGETDARYYLHLAAAYLQAERKADAERMLKESQAFGLDKFVLTADDRQLLTNLEKALGSLPPASDPQ